MRKFEIGDYVRLVPHNRLPWRLSRYLNSSRVESIKVTGYCDREYRISIRLQDGTARDAWAVPAYLEKINDNFEPFENEVMALLKGVACS